MHKLETEAADVGADFAFKAMLEQSVMPKQTAASGLSVDPWPNGTGDVSRFLSAPPAARRWFAHNRLLLGRAAVLTGIGGASKTTMLYHLAFAGVLGQTPWGWKIDTTGTAMLFLTEDTAEDVHHALAALSDELSDDERGLLARKLKVFPLAGEDVRLLSVDQGTLYENVRGMGLIERCAAADDLVFVGMDPALALTEGDEMSQSHQRYLGQYADKLAITTGAAVMLVTHATKASSNAEEITSHQSRGGGGITDAVRAEFVLRTMTAKEAGQHGINDPAERKKYVQLLCTKGNKLPIDAFAPVWLERGAGGRLQKTEFAMGEPQSGMNVTHQRILLALRDLCQVATPTRAEWLAECTSRGLLTGAEAARTKSLQRAIDVLIASGMIERGLGRGIYQPLDEGTGRQGT